MFPVRQGALPLASGFEPPGHGHDDSLACDRRAAVRRGMRRDTGCTVSAITRVRRSVSLPGNGAVGRARSLRNRGVASVNRRLLMIAYHFPPLAGSSGIQRTLRFAQYLPELGWDPIVLTAHPRAYARTSEDQLGDIGERVQVIRAPAWDTARHFALAGRYPRFLARPDRWASWWPGAVACGLHAIRRSRPDAIWSTYPIATAHRIGATLARWSGLPWVADFRDPMAQHGYPPDPVTRRRFVEIESEAVGTASRTVFTTPGAIDIYGERYPERRDRLRLVENGYDEETFASVQTSDSPLNPGRLTLVHSGVVYPNERNPRQLFAALEQLRRTSPGTFDRLRVRFRAGVNESMLHDLARSHDVEDAVEVVPPVPYREALEEMLRADGLLVLQASNCNQQVPAKLYEYFRARRPMLLLTDPAGDTARVARSAGITSIARLDDAADIADLFERFINDPSVCGLASEDAIAGASRRGRTRQLAALLDEVAT